MSNTILAETVKDKQFHAAQMWQHELLDSKYNSVDDHKRIPSDIEMVMRNPAVYADRIESGEIRNLPVRMLEDWTHVQRQAGAICTAQYAFSDTESTWSGENKLMELQNLAYTNSLWLPTRSLISSHLLDTATVFGHSIEIDHVDDSLLNYFSNNADSSQVGALVKLRT